jgi:lysophospholipase L1-like esterase
MEMQSFRRFAPRAAWCLAMMVQAATASAFELVDGDRVILLGSALIERDAEFGYLETRLTARFPDCNVLFRNLGWSGDTVFAEARAGFDTPAEGFARMKEQVRGLRPTCVFVAYGANESFAGEPGLSDFTRGLVTLLDMLGETGARLVLVTPPPNERVSPRLPDPARRNEDLQRYAQEIRALAARRNCPVVDLFTLLVGKDRELTSDGIQLTDHGYWCFAIAMEQGLGLPPVAWRVELAVDQSIPSATGTETSNVEVSKGGASFVALDHALPAPLAPLDETDAAAGTWPGAERLLRVVGLDEGRYELRVDGQIVATGTAADWAAGVPLLKGPEYDQVQQLREVIRVKNQFYFQRWRPQNDTYLLGFRKREQGQNAIEIPQFDPLVAEQEAIIAALRKPRPRRYELKPTVRPPVEAQVEN